MTIQGFLAEYDNLSADRQALGLIKLFEEITRNKDQHEELIKDILGLCEDHESDDGFGTEGLDV